ncbi:MAG: PucR family transcriptional regulator ligand-binding domain-containing protein [Nitriliruptoraceae bacterium]|nr:PucR family transcriptional regulator ligand-binding domain-containing protein [Nitriliruptoraceae bacterium]
MGHEVRTERSRWETTEVYDAPNVEDGTLVPLQLSDLLADPGLGLRVVAGADGVDRRGPIRWAHISELPDPTPWLEGGELLLTTGLGVRDDEQAQHRFVAGIAAHGVVALGFGTGVTLPEPPAAMRAACDAEGLPMFTVPYEVPFIAVTRRVAHRVFEQRDAMLRAAVGLQRQILASVTADGGVEAVLRAVQRAMPAVTLTVYDFSGRVLATLDDTGHGLDPEQLWRVLPRDRGRGEVAVDGTDRVATWATITVGDQVEAVVSACGPSALEEHQVLLFEQAVAGVHLELARERSVRDAHRRRIDELLEEVATGRATAASVHRTLERLGARPLHRYRVLAVRAPRAPEHALCTLVEDALVELGPPLVGRHDGLVHALVPEEGADAAERVLAAGQRRGWSDLRIGRSRPKLDVDALRAALREATVALNLDGQGAVRDVDELGLAGLLAGIRDDLGASDFVAQILGPVLEHDRGDGALVRSLRAYLAHGCRPGPAAEELRVHRHTLAYRLDRIRDLTGRDPRSGEHLTAYGLALALWDRNER